MRRWFGLGSVVILALLWGGCRRPPPPPPPPPASPVKEARYQPPPPSLPPRVTLQPEEEWVNGGLFVQGTEANDDFARAEELPERPTYLRRMFAMWRYPVTQGEFRALLNYNPSHFSACGAECPVEQVSWHEAAAFANAMSKRKRFASCYVCEGVGLFIRCKIHPSFLGKNYYHCAGYRLPTEAEWEKAARAGEVAAWYKPAISRVYQGRLEKIAWYQENSFVTYDDADPCPGQPTKRCGTQPVGRKEPNLLGLYDLLGNVRQWTADAPEAYVSELTTDPLGEKEVGLVLRGCAFSSPASDCRIPQRTVVPLQEKDKTIGFRLVRSLWFTALKTR